MRDAIFFALGHVSQEKLLVHLKRLFLLQRSWDDNQISKLSSFDLSFSINTKEGYASPLQSVEKFCCHTVADSRRVVRSAFGIDWNQDSFLRFAESHNQAERTALEVFMFLKRRQIFFMVMHQDFVARLLTAHHWCRN